MTLLLVLIVVAAIVIVGLVALFVKKMRTLDQEESLNAAVWQAIGENAA